MLERLRNARLVWPALATLVAFAMLIGLGTWQMNRLAWKEGLLQQIAERTHAKAVPLADVIELQKKFSGKDDPEYLHVITSGRFLHDKEQYFWAPDPDAGPGYHVFTPLQFAADEVVWVNRGFVPDAQKAPETRAAGQVAGDVTVTGLVRKPIADKGSFTPDNEPSKKLFFWRSLEEMHAAAFGGAKIGKAPFFIDADAEPANPGGLPKGGVTLLALPNRHLEYAITWYGLAATLLAVFAAFAVARFRRPP